MKTIVQYECEICRQKYNYKSAQACEARGYAKEYPIGCIYGNHEKGAFYENITFAVAINVIDGHANFGSSWACRDTGAGDSLTETCGVNSLKLNISHSKLDFEHPTFKRMVEHLKSINIPITIWNGKTAIPYKEKK